MRALIRRVRERSREVLGINRRNLDYVLDLNPRPHFVRADDKIEAKAILRRFDIPTPETIAVVAERAEIDATVADLAGRGGFVMKPARGFGGHGVFVIESGENSWLDTAGRSIEEADLRFAMASILAGMYSLNRVSDRALLEAKVEEDPALAQLHGGRGVCDLRLIVCRSRVVMAMLRLPCAGSHGTANLHAGGLGVGVEIESGTTHHAIRFGRPIEHHPDTGTDLSGFLIPHWDRIRRACERINEAFELGYLGVDVALDEREGPLVLEVNARPGLAIQLANREGLRAALERAEAAG